jgi:lipooligosaccharide transport system permease protein
MRLIPSILDWRSLAVLRRNMLVYLRNWRTAFLPPAMEPVVFFLAFGLGLGSHMGGLQYAGREISYATWVVPGLLAHATFSTPFFEALYSAYVRMFYQKTWDGMLATQIEMRHIYWGEVLWAGLRGVFNGAVVALVICIFELVGAIDISLGWMPLLPLVGGAAGWSFAAFGLIFTAIVPAIDHMNYPVFLIGLPLTLVSSTYFPIETDILPLRLLVWCNPVYHLAETYRALLVTGAPSWHLLGLLVSAGGLLLLCTPIVQRLLRRRVLGE